jgi:hypothetical protein
MPNKSADAETVSVTLFLNYFEFFNSVDVDQYCWRG